MERDNENLTEYGSGNRLGDKLKSGRLLVASLVLVGILAGVLIFLADRSGRFAVPEVLVQEYMTRVYARDYVKVYPLISSEDKKYKSLEEYLRENSPFTGFRLEASRKLASYMEFRQIKVKRQGYRATVTVNFVVPDGNAAPVREIIFADENKLTHAERQILLEKLDQLSESGHIPTFEGVQSFELVKENLGWRIVENWAEAVRVHLSGQVKHDLPWEFEPLQEMVLVKPGETVRAIYKAKNLSDQPVTAKARHIIDPDKYHDFLDTIQCFCLIQQTLQPKEEVEMAVVFQLALDSPPEAKDFFVRYEFFPIETFSGEER